MCFLAKTVCTKAVCEISDLALQLATGHESMGASFVVVAALWVALFLIPEALAARWGLIRAIANKR